MGFLTSRLVYRSLDDELRTEAPSLPVEEIEGRGLSALPIGNFRVIYREPRRANDVVERIVERVLHENKVEGYLESLGES